METMHQQMNSLFNAGGGGGEGGEGALRQLQMGPQRTLGSAGHNWSPNRGANGAKIRPLRLTVKFALPEPSLLL